MLISGLTKYRKYPLNGQIARLRAAGHVMQVKEFSMRFETPAGEKPF
jgi:hypothetical protein